MNKTYSTQNCYIISVQLKCTASRSHEVQGQE